MRLLRKSGRVGSLVAEVIDTAKIGAIVTSNALKEVLTATSEAVTTAVQDAKVVLGELAQGAQGAERVALAGIEETIPAGVEKSLANSMLREGGEASSCASSAQVNAAKAAINQGAPISLAGYDASLGNLEKLEEAANMFKNNPSAVAKDGPLTRLLQSGKAGSNIGDLGSARGAGYELEKAYDLTKSGEAIVEFGNKSALVHPDTGKVIKVLDVDIETATKIIERKSIDWSKATSKGIDSIKSKLPELRKLALAKGKSFELHSKFDLPNELRNWLNDQKITFIEG